MSFVFKTLADCGLLSQMVQLLQRALPMERKEKGSSQSLMQEDAPSLLIEAVGEKLKGQIFAGMVSASEQRVLEKVIGEIEELLSSTRQ